MIEAHKTSSQLVEMALSGLSWGECVAFEDHAESVFDDFEDDPKLSDKENRVRFWEAVNEAQLIAEKIVDLGTHIIKKETVYHIVVIDGGIPDEIKTFTKEEDAKQYLFDAIEQTIKDFNGPVDWKNVSSDHDEELLAKDAWFNYYFCYCDVEFRVYGGVVE